MKSDYLAYKGYFGSVDFSAEDRLFYGKVQFVDSLLAYDGNSVVEIESAFQETVDSYLQFCDETGKCPEKSCSGTFNVRIGSALHINVSKVAFRQGLGLNEFIIKALESTIENQPKIVNHLHTHNITISTAPEVALLTASMDKPSVWEPIHAIKH